ncbi:MAG: DUF1566 domain-containing protein [Flavobacterium sp.]|nr:DUF1566 domain-containing protein [Flavobacterium sp.]
MKKIYSIIAYLLLTVSLWAQAPQKMNYQAVVHNSNGSLITSTQISIRISVLQGSTNGTPVYIETQKQSTNTNGLLSLEIGLGIPEIGMFSEINWAAGPYFIKTETDLTGGTTYTITGISELMSVPYALFSSKTSVDGFSHYLGEVFNGGIIFYIYKGSDGLEHGLIVSPIQGSQIAWQTSPMVVNANRSWDGVYNTSLMTDSPAKNYIATLGSDWYLPSIDELSKLYRNRYYVQKGLKANGYTLMPMAIYWSSTEFNNTTSAYYLSFISGYTVSASKTTLISVIGIKAF